jgi:hypothetical protein
MASWRALLTCLLIALTAANALAQSELVIAKEGTSLYHRPGCVVIRDMEGILAMTRAQAEARGYKAHPDCDPARQPPAATASGPRGPSQPEAITVYLDGSKYYHRKDCAKLKAKGRAIEAKPLEVAGKMQWPCPTCKPPVRRKSTEPAVRGTGRRGR